MRIPKLGCVMVLFTCLFVIATIIICLLLAKKAQPIPRVRYSSQMPPNTEPYTDIDDQFLYDTMARTNESRLATCDALDNALIGILGGVGAIAIFRIDKLHELQATDQNLALWLFAASGACCVLGFIVGIFPIGLYAEEFDAVQFMKALSIDARQTMTTSINDLVKSSEINQRIRNVKRYAAFLSILLLVGAVIAITYARVISPADKQGGKAPAKVVYSAYGPLEDSSNLARRPGNWFGPARTGWGRHNSYLLAPRLHGHVSALRQF